MHTITDAEELDCRFKRLLELVTVSLTNSELNISFTAFFTEEIINAYQMFFTDPTISSFSLYLSNRNSTIQVFDDDIEEIKEVSVPCSVQLYVDDLSSDVLTILIVRKAEVVLTPENFDEMTFQFVCNGDILTSFSHLFEKVLNPFVESTSNLNTTNLGSLNIFQESFANFLTNYNELCSKISSSNNIINIKEDLNLNPKNGNSADILTPENIFYCETLVESWITLIKDICGEMQNIAAIRKNFFNALPSDELSYWKNRLSSINAIIEQLKQKNVKNIFDLLTLNRSTLVLKNWRKYENLLMESQKETKEICSYLSSFDKFNHLLNNQSFKEGHLKYSHFSSVIDVVVNQIPHFFEILLILVRNCNLFCDTSSVKYLLMLFNNLFIKFTRSVLFPIHTSSSLHLLLQIHDLKSLIQLLNNLDELISNYQFNFNQNRLHFYEFNIVISDEDIFYDINQFRENLMLLKQILEVYIIFYDLPDIKLNSLEYLKYLLKNLKTSTFDPLTTFDTNLKKIFTRVINTNLQVQKDLYQYLPQLFLLNENNKLTLVERINQLLSLEKLYKLNYLEQAFEDISNQLLKEFEDNVEELKKKFLKDQDKPTSKNLPLISSKISLVKVLTDKLTTELNCVLKLRVFLSPGFLSNTVIQYNHLFNDLTEFEVVHHYSFTKHIELLRLNLNQNLLTFDKDKNLVIMFASQLKEMIKNLKFLNSVYDSKSLEDSSGKSLDLPNCTEIVLKQQNNYLNFANKLEELLTLREDLFGRISPLLFPLLLHAIELVETSFSKGLAILTWNSMILDEYVFKCEHSLTLLKANLASLDNILYQRMLYPLLRLLKYKIFDFSYVLNEDIDINNIDLTAFIDIQQQSISQFIQSIKKFLAELQDSLFELEQFIVDSYEKNDNCYDTDVFLEKKGDLLKELNVFKQRLSGQIFRVLKFVVIENLKSLHNVLTKGYLCDDGTYKPVFVLDVVLKVPHILIQYPVIDNSTELTLKDGIRQILFILIHSFADLPIVEGINDACEVVECCTDSLGMLPDFNCSIYNAFLEDTDILNMFLCFEMFSKLQQNFSHVLDDISNKFDWIFISDPFTNLTSIFNDFNSGNDDSGSISLNNLDLNSAELIFKDLNSSMEILVEHNDFVKYTRVAGVSLSLKPLKAALVSELRVWYDLCSRPLRKLAATELKCVVSDCSEKLNSFSSVVKTINDFKIVKDVVNDVKDTDTEISIKIGQIKAIYDFIAKYNAGVQPEALVYATQIAKQYSSILKHYKNTKKTNIPSPLQVFEEECQHRSMKKQMHVQEFEAELDLIQESHNAGFEEGESLDFKDDVFEDTMSIEALKSVPLQRSRPSSRRPSIVGGFETGQTMLFNSRPFSKKRRPSRAAAAHREKQQHAAVVIQRIFRGYSLRKRLNERLQEMKIDVSAIPSNRSIASFNSIEFESETADQNFQFNFDVSSVGSGLDTNIPDMGSAFGSRRGSLLHVVTEECFPGSTMFEVEEAFLLLTVDSVWLEVVHSLQEAEAKLKSLTPDLVNQIMAIRKQIRIDLVKLASQIESSSPLKNNISIAQVREIHNNFASMLDKVLYDIDLLNIGAELFYLPLFGKDPDLDNIIQMTSLSGSLIDIYDEFHSLSSVILNTKVLELDLGSAEIDFMKLNQKLECVFDGTGLNAGLFSSGSLLKSIYETRDLLDALLPVLHKLVSSRLNSFYWRCLTDHLSAKANSTNIISTSLTEDIVFADSIDLSELSVKFLVEFDVVSSKSFIEQLLALSSLEFSIQNTLDEVIYRFSAHCLTFTKLLPEVEVVSDHTIEKLLEYCDLYYHKLTIAKIELTKAFTINKFIIKSHVCSNVEMWISILMEIKTQLIQLKNLQHQLTLLHKIFPGLNLLKESDTSATSVFNVFSGLSGLWNSIISFIKDCDALLLPCFINMKDNDFELSLMSQTFLPQLASLISHMEKKLEELLEMKRAHHPILFFITREHLLSLLATLSPINREMFVNHMDVNSTDELGTIHVDAKKKKDNFVDVRLLHSVFPFIEELVFDKFLPQVIIGFKTNLNEYIGFQQSIDLFDLHGEDLIHQIGTFMYTIKDAVKLASKKSIVECCCDANFSVASVLNSLNTHHLQAVMLANSVTLTNLIESSTMSGSAGRLESNNALNQLSIMICQLSSLFYGNPNNAALEELGVTYTDYTSVVKLKYILSNCLYYKDVFEHILRSRVKSTYDVEWASRFRVYLSKDEQELLIGLGLNMMTYGYDFLSYRKRSPTTFHTHSQLIAPVSTTDYVQLATTIINYINSGQYFVLKDSKSSISHDIMRFVSTFAGKMILTLNCALGCSSAQLSRLFNAAIGTDIWVLFHGINCLKNTVLEELNHYCTIYENAKKESSSVIQLNIESHPLKIDRNSGFVLSQTFVESSDEKKKILKQFARSVSLSKPNFGSLIFTSLISEGFVDASGLAKKISLFFECFEREMKTTIGYGQVLQLLHIISIMKGREHTVLPSNYINHLFSAFSVAKEDRDALEKNCSLSIQDSEQNSKYIHSVTSHESQIIVTSLIYVFDSTFKNDEELSSLLDIYHFEQNSQVYDLSFSFYKTYYEADASNKKKQVYESTSRSDHRTTSIKPSPSTMQLNSRILPIKLEDLATFNVGNIRLSQFNKLLEQIFNLRLSHEFKHVPHDLLLSSVHNAPTLTPYIGQNSARSHKSFKSTKSGKTLHSTGTLEEFGEILYDTPLCSELAVVYDSLGLLSPSTHIQKLASNMFVSLLFSNFIGLSGDSCSGKTTLIRALVRCLEKLITKQIEYKEVFLDQLDPNLSFEDIIVPITKPNLDSNNYCTFIHVHITEENSPHLNNLLSFGTSMFTTRSFLRQKEERYLMNNEFVFIVELPSSVQKSVYGSVIPVFYMNSDAIDWKHLVKIVVEKVKNLELKKANSSQMNYDFSPTIENLTMFNTNSSLIEMEIESEIDEQQKDKRRSGSITIEHTYQLLEWLFLTFFDRAYTFLFTPSLEDNPLRLKPLRHLTRNSCIRIMSEIVGALIINFTGNTSAFNFPLPSHIVRRIFSYALFTCLGSVLSNDDKKKFTVFLYLSLKLPGIPDSIMNTVDSIKETQLLSRSSLNYRRRNPTQVSLPSIFDYVIDVHSAEWLPAENLIIDSKIEPCVIESGLVNIDAVINAQNINVIFSKEFASVQFLVDLLFTNRKNELSTGTPLIPLLCGTSYSGRSTLLEALFLTQQDQSTFDVDETMDFIRLKGYSETSILDIVKSRTNQVSSGVYVPKKKFHDIAHIFKLDITDNVFHLDTNDPRSMVTVNDLYFCASETRGAMNNKLSQRTFPLFITTDISPREIAGKLCVNIFKESNGYHCFTPQLMNTLFNIIERFLDNLKPEHRRMSKLLFINIIKSLLNIKPDPKLEISEFLRISFSIIEVYLHDLVDVDFDKSFTHTMSKVFSISKGHRDSFQSTMSSAGASDQHSETQSVTSGFSPSKLSKNMPNVVNSFDRVLPLIRYVDGSYCVQYFSVSEFNNAIIQFVPEPLHPYVKESESCHLQLFQTAFLLSQLHVKGIHILMQSDVVSRYYLPLYDFNFIRCIILFLSLPLRPVFLEMGTQMADIKDNSLIIVRGSVAKQRESFLLDLLSHIDSFSHIKVIVTDTTCSIDWLPVEFALSVMWKTLPVLEIQNTFSAGIVEAPQFQKLLNDKIIGHKDTKPENIEQLMSFDFGKCVATLTASFVQILPQGKNLSEEFSKEQRKKKAKKRKKKKKRDEDTSSLNITADELISMLDSYKPKCETVVLEEKKEKRSRARRKTKEEQSEMEINAKRKILVNSVNEKINFDAHTVLEKTLYRNIPDLSQIFTVHLTPTTLGKYGLIMSNVFLAAVKSFESDADTMNRLQQSLQVLLRLEETVRSKNTNSTEEIDSLQELQGKELDCLSEISTELADWQVEKSNSSTQLMGVSLELDSINKNIATFNERSQIMLEKFEEEFQHLKEIPTLVRRVFENAKQNPDWLVVQDTFAFILAFFSPNLEVVIDHSSGTYSYPTSMEVEFNKITDSDFSVPFRDLIGGLGLNNFSLMKLLYNQPHFSAAFLSAVLPVAVRLLKFFVYLEPLVTIYIDRFHLITRREELSTEFDNLEHVIKLFETKIEKNQSKQKEYIEKLEFLTKKIRMNQNFLANIKRNLLQFDLVVNDLKDIMKNCTHISTPSRINVFWNTLSVMLYLQYRNHVHSSRDKILSNMIENIMPSNENVSFTTFFERRDVVCSILPESLHCVAGDPELAQFFCGAMVSSVYAPMIIYDPASIMRSYLNIPSHDFATYNYEEVINEDCIIWRLNSSKDLGIFQEAIGTLFNCFSGSFNYFKVNGVMYDIDIDRLPNIFFVVDSTDLFENVKSVSTLFNHIELSPSNGLMERVVFKHIFKCDSPDLCEEFFRLKEELQVFQEKTTTIKNDIFLTTSQIDSNITNIDSIFSNLVYLFENLNNNQKEIQRVNERFDFLNVYSSIYLQFAKEFVLFIKNFTDLYKNFLKNFQYFNFNQVLNFVEMVVSGAKNAPIGTKARLDMLLDSLTNLKKIILYQIPLNERFYLLAMMAFFDGVEHSDHVSTESYSSYKDVTSNILALLDIDYSTIKLPINAEVEECKYDSNGLYRLQYLSSIDIISFDFSEFLEEFQAKCDIFTQLYHNIEQQMFSSHKIILIEFLEILSEFASFEHLNKVQLFVIVYNLTRSLAIPRIVDGAVVSDSHPNSSLLTSLLRSFIEFICGADISQTMTDPDVIMANNVLSTLLKSKSITGRTGLGYGVAFTYKHHIPLFMSRVFSDNRYTAIWHSSVSISSIDHLKMHDPKSRVICITVTQNTNFEDLNNFCLQLNKLNFFFCIFYNDEYDVPDELKDVFRRQSLNVFSFSTPITVQALLPNLLLSLPSSFYSSNEMENSTQLNSFLLRMGYAYASACLSGMHVSDSTSSTQNLMVSHIYRVFYATAAGISNNHLSDNTAIKSVAQYNGIRHAAVEMIHESFPIPGISYNIASVVDCFLDDKGNMIKEKRERDEIALGYPSLMLWNHIYNENSQRLKVLPTQDTSALFNITGVSLLSELLPDLFDSEDIIKSSLRFNKVMYSQNFSHAIDRCDMPFIQSTYSPSVVRLFLKHLPELPFFPKKNPTTKYTLPPSFFSHLAFVKEHGMSVVTVLKLCLSNGGIQTSEGLNSLYQLKQLFTWVQNLSDTLKNIGEQDLPMESILIMLSLSQHMEAMINGIQPLLLGKTKTIDVSIIPDLQRFFHYTYLSIMQSKSRFSSDLSLKLSVISDKTKIKSEDSLVLSKFHINHQCQLDKNSKLTTLDFNPFVDSYTNMFNNSTMPIAALGLGRISRNNSSINSCSNVNSLYLHERSKNIPLPLFASKFGHMLNSFCDIDEDEELFYNRLSTVLFTTTDTDKVKGILSRFVALSPHAQCHNSTFEFLTMLQTN
ncbi:hypothetical protein PCE1_002398 [Barthelona sp. PCE]